MKQKSNYNAESELFNLKKKKIFTWPANYELYYKTEHSEQ